MQDDNFILACGGQNVALVAESDCLKYDIGAFLGEDLLNFPIKLACFTIVN